jgi:hypothetical protein
VQPMPYSSRRERKGDKVDAAWSARAGFGESLGTKGERAADHADWACRMEEEEEEEEEEGVVGKERWR